ncbi:MAG: hypothetical protein WCG03_07625, partial [Kiritimatiellales bacterium]
IPDWKRDIDRQRLTRQVSVPDFPDATVNQFLLTRAPIEYWFICGANGGSVVCIIPNYRVLSAAVHDVIFRRQSGLSSGVTI